MQRWITCHGNLSLLYFSSYHTKLRCRVTGISSLGDFYTFLLYAGLKIQTGSQTPSAWNVCLLITDEPDSSARRSPVSPIALPHLCSTLIGWGWSNLPPRTCFLSDPGARSVFPTNYHLPSEMICNVASSHWNTLHCYLHDLPASSVCFWRQWRKCGRNAGRLEN